MQFHFLHCFLWASLFFNYQIDLKPCKKPSVSHVNQIYLFLFYFFLSLMESQKIVQSHFSLIRPYIRYITFTVGLVLSTPLLYIEFSEEYPLFVPQETKNVEKYFSQYSF